MEQLNFILEGATELLARKWIKVRITQDYQNYLHQDCTWKKKKKESFQLYLVIKKPGVLSLFPYAYKSNQGDKEWEISLGKNSNYVLKEKPVSIQ